MTKTYYDSGFLDIIMYCTSEMYCIFVLQSVHLCPIQSISVQNQKKLGHPSWWLKISI